ncbi:hypothetical protein JYU14_04320 [Simkania negevensis]|uniref:Uncharacterized protein n=1 Tax=Simkania negevensis TaxID=83561 RepID=A0ABS3AUX1_9BACT|nr:hypothetical protein [Simkania negevensis]
MLALFLGFGSNERVGVVRDEALLRYARLLSVKGGVELIGMGELPLASLEQKRQRPPFLQGSVLIGGIGGKELLFRTKTIRLLRDADIEESLPYQLSLDLPFDPSTLLFEKEILRRGEEESEVAVWIFPKEKMADQQKQLSSIGIFPERISPLPAALASMAADAIAPQQEAFILYIDKKESFLLFLCDGKPLFFHNISLGEEFFSAIKRALLSCATALSTSENSPIYLAGVEANQRSLTTSLTKQLNRSVQRLPSPLPDLTAEEFSLYCLPLALAYEACRKPRERRRSPLLPPWRRFKRPLALFYSLSFTLALLLLFLGVGYQAKEKAELQLHYERVLQQTTNPMEEIEVVRRLSKEEIVARINALDSKLDSSLPPYSLMPTTPLVSDAIAWLNTHPLLQATAASEDAIQLAPIIVDSLHYSLVKRPTTKQPKDPYRTRVELSFRSTTPRDAREFHESILSDNTFVDTKQEVRWTPGTDSFRIAFFLKAKP